MITQDVIALDLLIKRIRYGLYSKSRLVSPAIAFTDARLINANYTFVFRDLSLNSIRRFKLLDNNF